MSNNEEGGEWVEGEGRLSSLIAVRGELAGGDLRALYLGWLLRVQTGELDEEEIEPPVPAGLGDLGASLGALAEFLRIDRDLLHVAAQASAPQEDTTPKHEEVRAWVAGLSTKNKDHVLTRLIVNRDQALVMELLQRFLKERAGRAAAEPVARRGWAGYSAPPKHTRRRDGASRRSGEGPSRTRGRDREREASRRDRRSRAQALGRGRRPDRHETAAGLRPGRQGAR